MRLIAPCYVHASRFEVCDRRRKLHRVKAHLSAATYISEIGEATRMRLVAPCYVHASRVEVCDRQLYGMARRLSDFRPSV